MDSTYFNSWLRQAQNVSSMRASNDLRTSNDELPRGVFTPPAMGTPVWPASSQSQSSASQTATDEPLDLRVKVSEPVDDTVPLDLTVNRSQSNESTSRDVSEPEKPSHCSYTSYPSNIPNHFHPIHATAAAAYSGYPPLSNLTQSALKYVPHTNDRKLHCTHCGYQCDLHMKEGFDRHIARHAPHSQHFYCVHCQKLFADQSSLQEHLPMHGLLHNYICSMCSIAFSKQSSYMSHMAEMHSRAYTPKADGNVQSQMASEHSLLRIGRVVTSPTDRSHSASTTLSHDTRSSPMSSNTGASNAASSPILPSVSRTAALSQPTFGQSLAKQIEAAISHQVSGGKNPSLSELMFMKTEAESKEKEPVPKPNAAAAATVSNPLNLMSLLDKVVEESIRAGPAGRVVEKPDLKFVVTFSDDEGEEVKECDSTVSTSQGNRPDVPASNGTSNLAAPSDNAENVITSTDRPVDSPSINNPDLAMQAEKRTQVEPNM